MKNFDNGIHLAVRGGGVKSAAAIGVLKALEELGIFVKSTSGASLGSIVSILVANGFNSRLFCCNSAYGRWSVGRQLHKKQPS